MVLQSLNLNSQTSIVKIVCNLNATNHVDNHWKPQAAGIYPKRRKAISNDLHCKKHFETHSEVHGLKGIPKDISEGISKTISTATSKIIAKPSQNHLPKTIRKNDLQKPPRKPHTKTTSTSQRSDRLIMMTECTAGLPHRIE